jgi:O-antigen ligase
MQIGKAVLDNKNAVLLITAGICFSAVIGCLIGMGRVSLAVSILASALFLLIFLVIFRDYRKGWLFFGALLPLWVLRDFRIPLWVFKIDASMLVIVFIAIAFIRYSFIKKESYHLAQIPYLGITMLFLAWHLISFSYGDQIVGLKILIKLCFGIFLYILMILSIPDTKSMGRIFRISLIASSIVLVFLICKYLFAFESPYLGIRIFRHTGSGKNQLGIFLGLLTPVAISYSVYRRRAYTILVASLFAIASFYTLSRGVWVSIIASIIFFVVFSRERKGYMLNIAAISLLVLAFWIFLYPSESTPSYCSPSERAKSTITLKDVEGGSSIACRKTLLVAGTDSSIKHPLLGVGLGNFRQISLSSNLHTARVSHNDYLQILCEQGIIGLLVYVILLFQFFRGNLQSIRSCSETGKLWIIEGASASFVALIVHSLFENKYEIMPVWFILGACGLITKWKAR